MKICYIVTRIDEIGGAQIHVRDLACMMSQAGHEVCVISGGNCDTRYLEQLEKKQIMVYRLKRLVREINIISDWLAVMRITEILRKEKPDVLSLHASKAGFIGRIAGKICGIATLFTAHGWSFSEGVSWLKRLFYAAAEKMVSYLAAKIINVSNYDKKLALRYGIVPFYKCTVIHNGMPDIAPGLLAKQSAEFCRIVMTARFAPQKDHALLLSVLKDFKNLQWHLDLIGTGPLESDIKGMVKELGMRKRVTFHGQTHQVEEILSKAHLFVLTSNWEGLPRSIIEALRAGLPVIASDVGGVAELIEHGKTGYLIPRSDGTKLAEYLGLLLTDPQRRARMGRESRKKYMKDFTFANMYERTVTVYKELTS
ncbi:MAG: glycosyltransferase family 4 protein [Spirochaetales bacterium]|nr:glycosyltransferase family 4 protein [Spirochaetales bacterium]